MFRWRLFSFTEQIATGLERNRAIAREMARQAKRDYVSEHLKRIGLNV